MKNNWQPLATAPKDGTPILGLYHDSKGFQVGIASWGRKCMGSTSKSWVCYWAGRDHSEDYKLILWMPLPEPPTCHNL